MPRSNKNFLVLGHTGVGKSSLINYLSGSNAAKTGTGAPCTQKNTWQKITCSSPFGQDESLTFYDSWGLEADKSEEWDKLIKDKLSAGWSTDTICGVIYCFSYVHRIENYELETIKKVLGTGYNLLIALTNADCSDHKDKKQDYHKRIDDYLKDYCGRYKSVDICSVNIKKIVGGAEQKGRLEALETLAKFSTENLYRIYCDTLDNIFEEFNEEINKRLNALSEFVKAGKPNQLWHILGLPFLLPPFLMINLWTEKSQNENYYKVKKILEDDIIRLRGSIISKIHQFGVVFSVLYNTSFDDSKIKKNLLIDLILGPEYKISSLGEVYRNTLIEMQKNVRQNIDFLKSSKTEIRF